jgi:hypothetical protein
MKRLIQSVLGLIFVGNLGFAETANSNLQIRDRIDHRDRSHGCTVELQTRRGDFLDSFTARSCRDAQWDCEQELRQRHREGRNPYAQCVTIRDDGGRDRGYWTCTARDRGWEEHAGGHQMSGRDLRMLEYAAIRECQRFHGECTVSCVQD